jgi:hypothetical protein
VSRDSSACTAPDAHPSSVPCVPPNLNPPGVNEYVIRNAPAAPISVAAFGAVTSAIVGTHQMVVLPFWSRPREGQVPLQHQP